MHETFPDNILETRFIPPENWKEVSFENPNTGHIISFSKMISTQNNKTLLILPGLSEFSEKYVETACFFFDQGFDVFIIDWAYQGRSTRYLKNTHKRHSDGYDADLSDLDYLIQNFINHDKELFLLAHSMGAHIGMRYLSEFNHDVKAAALSAPMLKIKSLSIAEKFYHQLLSSVPFLMERYIPGGKDWNEENRNIVNKDIFSSDPVRSKIHNQWSKYVPELQLGNPTLNWVKETLKSIMILGKKYSKINIPIVIGVGTDEQLVDVKEIKHAAKKMPQATLKILQNSKHEILMETDDIRNDFINEALKLYKSNF